MREEGPLPIRVPAQEAAPPGSRWSGLGSRAVAIPLAILVVCGALGYALLATGPVAERTPRPRQPRLVEVSTVSRSTETVAIEAMGRVVPTRQVVIQPEATGRVVEVGPEFVPGGRFEPGDLMLRIDPSDYELALRQRASDLAQARADLRIEEGNQSVALLEFELLGETVTEADRSLVLREPQLDTVRARVETAEAALARARLDLERTAVRSPFRALVRDRGAELGARIAPGTQLATLVDTDAYWVETALPVSQLSWIEIPGGEGEPGSAAQVVASDARDSGRAREGRVVRLLSDLEPEGRMARVLVRVEDPLALAPEHADLPPLLLDSFVNVEIRGRSLESVVPLDRSLLRDGDRVWVMDAEDRLDIRQVDVAFRGKERVLVTSGLAGGERVVVSDLSSPVKGMPLRIADESADAVGRKAAPSEGAR